MKSLYYILGVVVIAFAGLAIAFSVPPKPPTKRQEPPRAEVYVDAAQLAKLHPGSNILAQMKSLLGSSDIGRPEHANAPTPEHSPLGNVIELPGVSRQDIEAEIAQSATEALSKLESDEMQALHARLRAKRATMMESARSELMAQVREIDQSAVFKERSLVAQLGPDRLATQIKADALQSSLNVMSKATGTKPDTAKSGDSLKAMLASLQMTDLELKKITDTIASESINIKADALERAAEIRKASAAEIETSIASTESTERSKIESGIATARSEILAELSSSPSSLDRLMVPGGSVKPTVTVTPRLVPSSSSQSDLRAIRDRIAAMEGRIRADVAQAVTLLAARERVRVTFVRTNRAVPDATSRFAEKLKAGGQSVWGPVIAGISASPSPGRG